MQVEIKFTRIAAGIVILAFLVLLLAYILIRGDWVSSSWSIPYALILLTFWYAWKLANLKKKEAGAYLRSTEARLSNRELEMKELIKLTETLKSTIQQKDEGIASLLRAVSEKDKQLSASREALSNQKQATRQAASENQQQLSEHIAELSEKLEGAKRQLLAHQAELSRKEKELSARDEQISLLSQKLQSSLANAKEWEQAWLEKQIRNLKNSRSSYQRNNNQVEADAKTVEIEKLERRLSGLLV